MLTLPRFLATLPRAARRSGLARYLDLGRQRIMLGRLDDHLLRDIGLDRATAEAEAERPIWDAPDHWRR